MMWHDLFRLVEVPGYYNRIEYRDQPLANLPVVYKIQYKHSGEFVDCPPMPLYSARIQAIALHKTLMDDSEKVILG